jgi:predicted nucleotidyltransferase
MDVARPYAALVPTLDGAVLNALVGTTRPLSGRELSRLVGKESHMGVQRVLNRLVGQGLVNRQEAGRALLYTLNREHLATPAVVILSEIRQELLRRLRETIGSWQVAPVHASMFGSTARGDGDSSSDIDLFVIRPRSVDPENHEWRGQLDDLAASALRWTGNRLSVSEAPEEDIPALRREERPILRELDADGILLAGRPLSDVVVSTP